MSRQLRPSEHCLNCGTQVATRFCAACGQENTNYRVSLARLLGDLFEELFQLESRLWRTLWMLFRHPGALTREYNAGRRVRYTTPLRLYLTASVAYFFIAAVVPPRVGDARQVRVQLSEHDVDIDELPPPKNWVDQRIRERLGVIKKLDPKEVSARARALLVNNTPKVMAVLLPLFALLLMMFFWGHFYVEHLVFALHVHAFAFFSGALAELTRSDTVENLVWLGVLVWTFIALRAV
ncbi:MAG TPA: DUF3667 domain-containing protein, partial [Polyangia bacterium]